MNGVFLDKSTLVPWPHSRERSGLPSESLPTQTQLQGPGGCPLTDVHLRPCLSFRKSPTEAPRPEGHVPTASRKSTAVASTVSAPGQGAGPSVLGSWAPVYPASM